MRDLKKSANELQGNVRESPSIRRACAICSATAVKGDIFPRCRSRVERAGPDQPVVILLFDDVGAPAGDARADEDRRIEFARDAHQEVGHGRIEVEIRIETFHLLHDTIDDGRNLKPTAVAAYPAQ